MPVVNRCFIAPTISRTSSMTSTPRGMSLEVAEKKSMSCERTEENRRICRAADTRFIAICSTLFDVKWSPAFATYSISSWRIARRDSTPPPRPSASKAAPTMPACATPVRAPRITAAEASATRPHSVASSPSMRHHSCHDVIPFAATAVVSVAGGDFDTKGKLSEPSLAPDGKTSPSPSRSDRAEGAASQTVSRCPVAQAAPREASANPQPAAVANPPEAQAADTDAAAEAEAEAEERAAVNGEGDGVDGEREDAQRRDVQRAAEPRARRSNM